MPAFQLTELVYGEGDIFPLFAYEYNAQGYYSEPETIKDMVELDAYFKKNLKKILDEKRELRITDTGDLLCFHVQNGKILYDGEKHYPEGKPLPNQTS